MTIENDIAQLSARIDTVIYFSRDHRFLMRFTCPACGMLTTAPATIGPPDLRCSHCERLLDARQAQTITEE